MSKMLMEKIANERLKNSAIGAAVTSGAMLPAFFASGYKAYKDSALSEQQRSRLKELVYSGKKLSQDEINELAALMSVKNNKKGALKAGAKSAAKAFLFTAPIGAGIGAIMPTKNK